MRRDDKGLDDVGLPAAAAVWGGYTAYFTDPDGHAWEIAHNPGWPLDDSGMPLVGGGEASA